METFNIVLVYQRVMLLMTYLSKIRSEKRNQSSHVLMIAMHSQFMAVYTTIIQKFRNVSITCFVPEFTRIHAISCNWWSQGGWPVLSSSTAFQLMGARSIPSIPAADAVSASHSWSLRMIPPLMARLQTQNKMINDGWLLISWWITLPLVYWGL